MSDDATVSCRGGNPRKCPSFYRRRPLVKIMLIGIWRRRSAHYVRRSGGDRWHVTAAANDTDSSRGPRRMFLVVVLEKNPKHNDRIRRETGWHRGKSPGDDGRLHAIRHLTAVASQ
jgi:hypothetical protein